MKFERPTVNKSRIRPWLAGVLMLSLSVIGTAQCARQLQVETQAPPAAPERPQQAQPQPPPPPQGQRGRGGWQGPMDEARARQLYVSNDHVDHGRGVNFERQIQLKAEEDKRWAQVTAGVVDFQKVSYRSSIGDLDIPAYVFQPLKKRGANGHAALIWVHGGVHGDWAITFWPFVREAVERGYVIVAPEYRGSTGYGEKHYMEIDYGGYEIDDVMTAVDYLKTLPHVDPERLGIMGWSHGGYIALFSVFREQTPFKAAVAMVPVTNLIHRLSFSGPGYQRSFATQKRIGGLPFEKREEYIKRSPLFHVDKLRTPLLVHVATNDTDVWYYEDQQIVDALRSRKPDLAETKVYEDPPVGRSSGGHTFNRRVNPETLEREDSPEQIDSWNRVWALFEKHVRPGWDGSAPQPPVRR